MLRGDGPPCLFEGLAGDGDGVVDVFLCGFVDFADGLFVARVDDFERLAILAFYKLIVDEAERVVVSEDFCSGATRSSAG